MTDGTDDGGRFKPIEPVAPPMAERERIGAGAWLDLDGDPTGCDDLVLAVARRRGDEPASVEREFRRIAERFDVDAVYVAPAADASPSS